VHDMMHTVVYVDDTDAVLVTVYAADDPSLAKSLSHTAAKLKQ
jgi:hypothetical protein